MKLRISAVFLLMVLLLSGCNRGSVREGMDAAQSALKRGANAAKDAVTGAQRQLSSQAVTLTREEAEARALNHAGVTADQVTGLRTEYEIDDGVPRYEVQFRYEGWEYDYEINANTGAILSYDRDN